MVAYPGSVFQPAFLLRKRVSKPNWREALLRFLGLIFTYIFYGGWSCRGEAVSSRRDKGH